MSAQIRIADATIRVGYSKRLGDEGRTRYRWTVKLDSGRKFTGDDLQSGCQGGDCRNGLESLLSFLGACGEALNYSDRSGHESENADLFERELAEWCAANTDELGMAEYELTERGGR